MICDAGTTCFKSKKADVLAAIDTLPSKSMLLIVIDAVTAAVVGLQMTMFVTTAVLPDGVVYRVVDVVAAAVRARTLLTVAISYYLSVSLSRVLLSRLLLIRVLQV